MYTQCPECRIAFRVTAKVLQQAQGNVRCGGCGHAFNALQYLSEELPGTASGDDPGPASDELAETSRRLLQTLDELAGEEDVRIEDTGIEWRVLDDTITEPAGDDERRYDDNSPLPDEYDDDDDDGYVPPTPRRRESDVAAPSGQFVERQQDLLLSEPEDWTDILEEVADADGDGDALAVEEELAAIHNELASVEDALAPSDDSGDTRAGLAAPPDDGLTDEVRLLDMAGLETGETGGGAGDADAIPYENIEAVTDEIDRDPSLASGNDPEPLDDDEDTGVLEILGEDRGMLEALDEDTGMIEALDEDTGMIETRGEDAGVPEADAEDIGDPDTVGVADADRVGAESFDDVVTTAAAAYDAGDDETGIDRETLEPVGEALAGDGEIDEPAPEDDRAAATFAGIENPEALFDENAEGVETIIMEGEFVRSTIEKERVAAENAARSQLDDPARLADTYALSREKIRGGRRSYDPPALHLVAAIAVLALLLVGQFVHNARASLATYGFFQHAVVPVYRVFGNPVAPQWDIRGWQFEATSGSVNEEETRLTIVSRIANRSEQALPYPLVHVSLTNRFEDIMGSRVLAPADYLSDGLAPDERVAPGDDFTAVIVIEQPSPDATGFKLNVCYRVETGVVRCAIEDFK